VDWAAEKARDGGVRISANGISGTVWSGSAASAAINGIILGRTDWSISPWYLPLGTVASHWRIEPQQGYLEGEARIGRNSLRLANVEGKLPAMLLVNYIARAPLPLVVQGDISVHMDDVLRNGDKIESASGTLVWHQAALAQPFPVKLGDLKAEFAPAAYGAIAAKLSDSGSGPLALKGNITLKADGTYRFNATLTARSGADPALANALPLMGMSDGMGGYQIVWAGRFAR
jgi:hypothetical protein